MATEARNAPLARSDDTRMRLAWEKLSWYLALALIAATVVGATVGLTGTAIGNGSLTQAGADVFGFAMFVAVPLILARMWINRKGRELEAMRGEVGDMASDAASIRSDMDEALVHAKQMERTAESIDKRLEEIEEELRDVKDRQREISERLDRHRDEVEQQFYDLQAGMQRRQHDLRQAMVDLKQQMLDANVIPYPRRWND